MINSVDTTSYSADPSSLPSSSSASKLAAPSQSTKDISTELQEAAEKLSTTTSDSSLTQLISNLQQLIQSLMSALQGLFAPSLEIQPGIGQPAPGTNPGGSNGLVPMEEPPILIPIDQGTPGNKPGATTNPIDLRRDDSNPISKTEDPSQTTPADPPTTTSTKRTKKTKGKGKTRNKKAKTTMKGKGEFLWKPKSDKDGKLAVLLPKHYTGQVESLEIISSTDGTTLAKGQPAGVGNGDREHFRFNRAGDAFPDGSIVQVTLKDGSKLHVQIDETSERTTN